MNEKSLFPKEIKAYHQLTQDNWGQPILGFLGLICLLLIRPHVHEALLCVYFVNDLVEETLADLRDLALRLLLPCLHPLISVDLGHQGLQSLEGGCVLIIWFHYFEEGSKCLSKGIACNRSFGGVARTYGLSLLCNNCALCPMKLLLVSSLDFRVSPLFELSSPSLQLLVMRVKIEVSVTLWQLLEVQGILES